MTDYEIISIVIAILGLILSVIAIVIKLFAYFDNRYQKKRK